MTTGLIGATGFVGSTLLRQTGFDRLYRSANIESIRDESFSLVVCAGAPGSKWQANQHPRTDRERLTALMRPLEALRCSVFVLISTVDVFAEPRGVDESATPDGHSLPPYGKHRLELEQFVREHFPEALVVRLPGLVGPGLRKNALYDLQHDNDVDALDGRAVYQFYPAVALWGDILHALDLGLRTVHLTAEPVQLSEVARVGFGRELEQTSSQAPSRYDVQSRHAAEFGGVGRYQYSARESLLAIRAYAQSEARMKQG